MTINKIRFLFWSIHLNKWFKKESAYSPIYKARDIQSALNKFYKERDEYGYLKHKDIQKSFILSIEKM